MDGRSRRILTINTGSSSLRAGLYDVPSGEEESLVLSADADRLGMAGGRLRIADAEGRTLLEHTELLPDHAAALETLFAWLHEHSGGRLPDAAGHRVVHGGADFTEPQRVTPTLMSALERLVQVAPNHLPQAIVAIRTVAEFYPELEQIACFDTAFHRRMPRVAQRYALPRRFEDEGLIRYGFHGLSYEYVMQALRQEGAAAADGRVIIAHLGNGASMAAVRDGVGIDTTMGFTPTAGLVMGTRSGDLDPGLLLHLMREPEWTGAALSDLLNKQSGLLGVSGSTADMGVLLQRERDDPRAADAVELFCYVARKQIGALSAALGGLDTLVFTAGIGEHAVAVRGRICAELGYLGVRLDADRNETNAPVISAGDSRVVVRVVRTDENRMIARYAYAVLYGRAG